MDLAGKDAVVILDGDLQDPPELIEEMYARMLEGYDVVFGHRVRREMSRWAELPYRAFYRVFQATSDIAIPRDAGDFGLMTRPVVDWMLQSPERDLFVRGMRAYVGFRQTGVDYVRPDRAFGKSTNNVGKNIGWAKKAIFAYSRKPLDLLTNLGFVFLGLSVVVIVAQTVSRLLVPSASPLGFTTTFLSIWLLGSLVLLGIGVLGEYLSKVLEEVKERPRWIRASITRDGREEPQPAPAWRPHP
jgi:dolichol-phosphate mannosyltransferase